MELCTIPVITEPLGRYWRQPKTDNMLIDDKTALMSAEDFEALADYSASTPSGAYAGKMWKSQMFDCEEGRPIAADVWHLRWYEDDSIRPDMLLIKSRLIVIVEKDFMKTPGKVIAAEIKVLGQLRDNNEAKLRQALSDLDVKYLKDIKKVQEKCTHELDHVEAGYFGQSRRCDYCGLEITGDKETNGVQSRS